MRSYSELLVADPAWPALEAAARQSGRVTILPCDAAAARMCIEQLQVTTRSSLGALAHETGGLLIDSGWLRLFGSGHTRMRRTLGGWNKALGIPVADFLVVGDDIVGGAFAINGGALGPALGNVFYFAPDALAWEDMELGHGALLEWAFEGNVEQFYAHLRWPGWQEDVAVLGGDQALCLYPPPWCKEGQDVSKVARGMVSAHELWGIQHEFAEQLESYVHDVE